MKLSRRLAVVEKAIGSQALVEGTPMTYGEELAQRLRLRAAQAILDHAGKGVELLDFEERLIAVEQFAKESDRR